MDVIQTLKVKNLNGTFEQSVPIGARSKYIYRDDDGFSTNKPLETDLRFIESEIERLDGPKEVTNSVYYKIEELEERLYSNKDIDFTDFQSVTNEFNKLNGGPKVTNSISNKIIIETLMNQEDSYNNFLNIGNGFRAILNDDPDANKNGVYYNNFEDVGDVLRTLQGDVNTEGSIARQIDQLHKTILNDEKTYETLKSVGDRLRFLEGSEAGSIKNQISTAKSEILGGAGADYDTLKEIQGLFEELKTGEKDAFDTLGEIATGIENNKKAIESNDTDIANLDKKIDTSITNLIDSASEGYKTLGDIETSVKSINSTINSQISDLSSDMSTLNSTINNRIDRVEQNVSNKDTETNNRIDALIGTLPQEAQYSTIEAINANLTTLNGTSASSINGKINTAISNLIGGASSSLDTLKEIETFLNNLVSNNEDGLDSLSELANAYSQLDNLIGEIPNNEVSNLVEYAQQLIATEQDRAVKAEGVLQQNLNTLSNEIDVLEEKIDNTTNNALELKINNVESKVKFDSISETNDDITISLSKIGYIVQINISGILNTTRSNFFFDTISTEDIGLLSSKILSKYILVAPSYFGKLELYENGHFFLGGFTDLNGNLVELPAMTEIAITESFMLDQEVIIIEGGVEEVNPVGVGG